MKDDPPPGRSKSTRRAFLRQTGTTAAAAVFVGTGATRQAPAEVAPGAEGPSIEGAVPITLRINGKDRNLRVDPRTTLLDCIRETVALTGTKKGCDHGQCGACTVHVNGRRVNSCLSLALMHDGEEITTIEGLGTPDALHPDAGGVRRVRRVSVRLLHVGPDHVGRRVAQGTVRSRRCGREGTDERQHLPLRRLPQHRGGDPASSQERLSSGSDPCTPSNSSGPRIPPPRSRRPRKSKTAQQGADVRFIAGGTTLLDLMKLNVETPARLLDINRLPLDKIEATPDGGLKIGATVRNSDLAHDPTVQRDYAVLSQALLAGASAQLRNMATTAGNLLQRTRCVYFRDTAMPCNKREPGTGCPAITGSNRTLAILGTSEHCIATNPSDMCVAMAALEATIHVQGPKGSRAIPFGDFHLLPGNTPHRETVLEPGDLITHVTLPPPVAGSKQVYLKLRDRASYEFALASAAVVLTRCAGGKVTRARIALGGVGTKPWRSPEAEKRARRSAGERGELPQGGGGGPARRQAAERERIQDRAGEALPRARAADGRDGLILSRGRSHGHSATTTSRRRRLAIGRDTPRVDGPLKVSGMAQYTSDFHFPGLLYAVPVEATIANGRVVKLDTAAAEKMPGVRAIFHRGNIGKIFRSVLGPGFEGIGDERRPPFEDDVVRYYGQYVALAVADTFETAKAAADAVRVTYAREKPNVDLNLEADDEPDVVATTFGPTKRLQSERGNRRGRVRDGAGQARPDLRHAGRDAQSHRAARDDRDLGWPEPDALRVVAGRRQPPERARADVRPAEGERPRHHEVRRLGLRQQAVSLDALRARRRRGAAARQAGQARPQPQDDVPDGRPSSAHPAARAPGRDRRRQARLAPARLRLPHVDARRLPRGLRRGDGVPVQRAQPARDLRPRPAQHRLADVRCAAPAPCPGSTRPSRR